MPGLVGYTLDGASEGRNPLEGMINAMGNFVEDRFYGRSLHVARLHLGVFNVEKQPTWNENRALGIMTYGKIYGYEQEMRKLKDLGHKIRKTNNDTEFILHAYEEFGNNVFAKLNGSYAFIIFNDQEGRLVVVSDRFGTRPVYYALKDGNLIFASAARAILEYPYPKVLDEKTIVKFFRFGKLGILGDDTWFKGIRVMPPASFLEFHEGKMRIEKYWDLNYSADYSKREELLVRELVRKFGKAVNTRISDNIKFGVALSGGLDSRSVCAAISKEKLSKVHAFTIGIKNCNEIKVAKLVTNRIGLKKNHILIELDPENLIRYAKEVVYLTDGMDMVSVSYLPYAIEKVREAGIEVFLQGFALDLTLGGSYMDKRSISAKNLKDLVLALDRRCMLFSLSELKALLTERLMRHINDVHREFVTTARNAKGDTYPNKADYFYMNTRVRRFTLMGSIVDREFVEESLPTIDNEVIDIITKIPPKYRGGHHLYKKFLSVLDRELASIPYVKTMVRANASDVLWKFGMLYLRFMRFIRRVLWKFSGGRIYLPNKHDYIDMSEVWRTSPAWRKLLNETILKNGSLCYKLGYLNNAFVRNIIKEHYGGTKNNSEKIAFLVTFELFLRIFFRE
ncbi:MAG: asparagine synthase-related protein [Candidatus Bathyarchaeota archaeon]|nr:asparagine synthase-related protein [Candidatus Bathyarchaeota archaeon]